MVDFESIRNKSIISAKKDIRESISEDNYIINAINNIDELTKTANTLTKRLRDWYALCLPELSKRIADNETFVKLVISKDRKELFQELKIKESMGKDLDKRELKPVKELALQIKSIYSLRDELKKYLETIMSSYCKNLFSVTGALLGAKLIEEAGSLKRLAMMPSSTVQLLGAEKALFRHLKTGARPPKHGTILQHTLVSSAKKNVRGRAARSVADKISMAVKTDYFKGKFIGDRLNKELEEKLR
ncbi:MAG: hypothetical protein KKF89_01335 [Nanoarchaeota archaeon]|nr:hypothetical protein [Nanoarchaeota archaeon]MBU1854339.1 hypothetical protein [Nanoarchaeota archaeon]